MGMAMFFKVLVIILIKIIGIKINKKGLNLLYQHAKKMELKLQYILKTFLLVTHV